MTCARGDAVLLIPQGVSLAGHVLETRALSATCVLWQLRCGGCLTELLRGALVVGDPLLIGLHVLPGTRESGAVSWATGAVPLGRTAADVEVVFRRGALRGPVVAPAHPLGALGWVAAVSGPTRDAIAVAPGASSRLAALTPVVPACRDVLVRSS